MEAKTIDSEELGKFRGTTIELELNRAPIGFDGKRLISAKELRLLLQIRSRTTFVRYKKAVGLQWRGGWFSETDVVEFLKLKLFLDSPEKKYTFDLWASYSTQPRLHPILLRHLWKERGINFEHEVAKVKAAIATLPGWEVG